MEETRRIAPDSPRGQKRIVEIKGDMVFRIRFSDWRGATWVQQDTGIVWLLGSGDRADVYEYLVDLYAAGRLMPNDEDDRRDAEEEIFRFLARVRDDARRSLDEAADRAGDDVTVTLAERVPAVVHMPTEGDGTELWVAVSTLDVDHNAVPPRLRDAVLAIYGDVFKAAASEVRSDWPTGRRLRWFEYVQFYLGLV